MRMLTKGSRTFGLVCLVAFAATPPRHATAQYGGGSGGGELIDTGPSSEEMARATEEAKAKAARIAAQRKERAKRLAEAKTKLDAASPKRSDDPELRAASLVRLGTALEASNPRGAIDHYVRALQAAPKGQAAAEAKSRLTKLGINPEAAVLPVYTLVQVVDGDSVVLRDGNAPPLTVDLAGLETPVSGKGADAAVKASTNALRALLKESKLAVRIESDEMPDTPATAVLFRPSDGLEINREIIRQGFARASANRPVDTLAEYQKLEREARQAGRGLWAAGARPGSSKGVKKP